MAERFKLIKSDTRSWSSGRVKLSLIGIPDKPDTYYILLEKDFFGSSRREPQRFLLRATDWDNLKRLVEGPGDLDGWGIDAEWSLGADGQQAAAIVARNPDLLEVVLGSPNLGKFGQASLESLDRLASRILDVKREHLELIFRRLAESSTGALESFSVLLNDLRLNQVSLLSGLVYQKLKVLDLLERVVVNPTSSEGAVHRIFDGNPWLLGKGFEIVQSDKPLSQYLERKAKDDPEMLKRPDLIVKRVPNSNDLVLVELKAPGISLKADHIGQVLTYKALIGRHKANVERIHCFLFGYDKSDTFARSSDVEIQTFGELISKLRDEYREYSDVLEDRDQDVPTAVQAWADGVDEPPF